MRSRLLQEPARFAGASLLRMQSDERLAALALDGHEPAFTAIVDRYRASLTRYSAGIVGPDRAEDVVQQTLINAHAALTKTSDVRHLRSWLYRIAHNTALNTLRAVRDEVPLDPAHATADGPDAAFERSERLRATLTAVRDLPERQRAALLLRELEGRSHEEIATALGVTAGSARQHLLRARASVRGAVTAITPYPLVARLAEGMAGGPPAWSDAVAGAGISATVAKFTAGVAATGALVGGVVGTNNVVRPHELGATTAPSAAGTHKSRIAHAARAAPAPAVSAAPAQRASSRAAVVVPATFVARRTTRPAPSGSSGSAGSGSGRSGEDNGGSRRPSVSPVGSGHSGESDRSTDDSHHSGSSGSGSAGAGEDRGGAPSGSSGSGDGGRRVDRSGREDSLTSRTPEPGDSSDGTSGDKAPSTTADPPKAEDRSSSDGPGPRITAPESGISGSGRSGSGGEPLPTAPAPGGD